MADIKLFRVDERLIHGQIIASWLNKINIDTIIVANNKAVNNELQKSLFKLAVPSYVNLKILSIDQVDQYLKSTNEKIMLITGDLESTYELIKNGLMVTEINIGNISQKKNKKQVCKSVWIDDNDFNYIKKLNNNGIKLNVQSIPTDKKRNLIDLI